MKKNDSVTVKVLKPRKKIVDFLLKFSQSIAVIETAKRKYTVSKN